ncbi:MAG: ABC transporter permease [Candidatus Aminicenantia bacterium]
MDKKLAKPSRSEPFGRDELGRDVLARLSYGGRISLTISVVVVFISTLIGLAIGMFSGWMGGFVDELIGRVVDFFLAFPGIILVMALSLLFGSGILNLIISLTIANSVEIIKVSRAQTIKIKNMDFIKASMLMGASSGKILFNHILPHVFPLILTYAILSFPFVILSESGLSFIGIGISPPLPSWGNMIAEGRYYLFDSTHLALFPSFFLFISIVGFNLIGESLEYE